MKNGILEDLKRMKAIADIGLLYRKDEYDRERYEELQAIAFRLLHAVSGYGEEALKETFPLQKDYPTAKVDIRAFVLSPNGKVLLVREQSDGRWSLPGGWAEVGSTPSETVVRECKEETGLDVVPKKLVAVFDKRKHPHPPEPHYVFKMVFWCEALTAEISKGFDVLEVKYFDVADLPPLSENRILASQIQTVYRKVSNGDNEAYFD